MPLNGKNNRFVKYLICLTILVGFYQCSNNNEPLSEAEQRAADSLSKVRQKVVSDSLKKTNPLLIIPPDSNYTGEYTDKYPSGIVKFKGQFRFGERHGQWLSFYPNGMAWSELHFDKGLREGLNVTYFENGKINYTGYYKNDKQDSLWLFYDTLGMQVAKVIYKNNRVVRELPVDKEPQTKVKH